jgi:hypothetical protein
VSLLHAGGSSRETIRKSIVALAQVFDHAGIAPNPARDRVHVRLPREKRAELNPPTGEHVRAVHRLLSPRYRLPLLGARRDGYAARGAGGAHVGRRR